MKTAATVLVCALLASLAATAARADNNMNAVAKAKAVGAPHTYTASHQPNGKPTQASSFAPHSDHSKRHVYGAPIQSPILGRAPPKKPASAPVPK